MTYKLVVKDAFWQILGRIISAVLGFVVISLISPYLGKLRFGDYSTILKFFAIWSAFADFGIYVIALKRIGEKKNGIDDSFNLSNREELTVLYSKFVSTRLLMVICVYSLALIVAYFIPSYTSNPYLIRGLPLGMLFSASFMTAGILQIPLQLFWKMKHLSIGLVLARISQLIILIIGIFFLFPNQNFDFKSKSIIAFALILFSVFMSGATQAIYVYFEGRKDLKLRWIFDRKFTKNTIISNWKYGFSYYLSSFHTLIVLILLSIIYPTIQNYPYAGVWALALALIEILLIVPSALGNSLIHRIAGTELNTKLKSFGSLMTFIIWIGVVFLINFTIFAPNIIYFVGKQDFLTNGNSIGSDYILPFLAIVLLFSFIKQVFNYLFVATENQNKLLGINFIGVLIGTIIGVPLIIKYNIIGGIITQILLEILFVSGAIFVAIKNKVIPFVQYKNLGKILIILLLAFLYGKFFIKIGYDQRLLLFARGFLFNGFILLFSYKIIKLVLKEI